MSQQPTDFNPYQPATGPVGQNIDQSFLARTAKELARWQTFFAVLMTIGIVAMMGVMSFAMLADGGGNTGAEIGGLACVGGATILIYGLPAVMLWRAASAARDYARAPGSPQLAQFASSQLSFWRTIGIMAVVILGIYALIFVGAMMLNVTISN